MVHAAIALVKLLLVDRFYPARQVEHGRPPRKDLVAQKGIP